MLNFYKKNEQLIEMILGLQYPKFIILMRYYRLYKLLLIKILFRLSDYSH